MRNRKQDDGPRLPGGWTRRVRAALLQVLSLAQFAVARTRGWAAERLDARIWFRVENARLRQEVALLREEIRIKDARMAQIPAQRRPHYPPTERMSILELKAFRGWSLEQTARAFLIAAATVAAWLGRLNEEGPKALVQLHEPVNKFPAFVGLIVRRLKTLCPMLGKRKIAQVLARAGLHLGRTTVDRLLKPKPTMPLPCPRPDRSETTRKRVITANYADHVWHVDLSVVPIGRGFWTPWLPFSLPQLWPFCWWVAVVADHYSRRIQGIAAFRRQPNSEAVRAFLGRTIQRVKASPKHLICDKGSQFFCDGFKAWCRRRGLKPRFGAVGQHGSIAIVERAILTIKTLLAHLPLMPIRKKAFAAELGQIVAWHNEHRPHSSLGGRTPDEVYQNRRPANRAPRFEPRAFWPRGSPCAKPWALVRGKPGARIELDVEFQSGRKHLPIVRLKRAA